MMNYLLKRLLLMIPTLIGITLVTFFVMNLAPGDPETLKLRFAGEGVDPDVLAAILKDQRPPIELPTWFTNSALSLSAKVHGGNPSEDSQKENSVYKTAKWGGEKSVMYFKWMGNLLRLDFGFSSKDRRPVLDKILEALPLTLTINLLTILVVYSISLPLGVISAVRKGSLFDRVVMVKLFIFYSIPTFWIATMLLILFASGEYYNLFPLMGYKSENHDELGWFAQIMDYAWHLALPVFADSVGSFAFLTRFTRGNFLDVIRQDYIRTARAKGLTESRVLFKHGLRNALIPFVTMMGTLLPGLLGGAVVIEQIFSIPGMGMLSFEAALGRDHNVIMGISTITAFLTLVSLLISDLMYKIVDPRIQFE